MSTKQEKVTDKGARASYFLLENMSSNISCWFKDIEEDSKKPQTGTDNNK